MGDSESNCDRGRASQNLLLWIFVCQKRKCNYESEQITKSQPEKGSREAVAPCFNTRQAAAFMGQERSPLGRVCFILSQPKRTPLENDDDDDDEGVVYPNPLFYRSPLLMLWRRNLPIIYHRYDFNSCHSSEGKKIPGPNVNANKMTVNIPKLKLVSFSAWTTSKSLKLWSSLMDRALPTPEHHQLAE